MKCPHLTQAGHCAEVEHRPPCTARLCGVKNEARPRHLENLARCPDREARRQYLEGVSNSEGQISMVVLRAEYIELHSQRAAANAAAAAQEGAGGDK